MQSILKWIELFFFGSGLFLIIISLREINAFILGIGTFLFACLLFLEVVIIKSQIDSQAMNIQLAHDRITLLKEEFEKKKKIK